jgi:hypothetical protein
VGASSARLIWARSQQSMAAFSLPLPEIDTSMEKRRAETATRLTAPVSSREVPFRKGRKKC